METNLLNVNITTHNTCDLIEELKTVFSDIDQCASEKIQIFVHGSWADNTRTLFSDLDDFIIVDDDYYDIVKPALHRIEYKFQQIDPLQHHGHWLVRRSQLSDYDNSYMPLFIMKDAVCIKGSSSIDATVKKTDYKKKTIQRIKYTCQNIESFYGSYKNGQLNIYDVKRFVGSILLLPPLIYQIQGEEKDKRTAIESANVLFSEITVPLIKWASDLRTNWDQLSSLREYKKLYEDIGNYTSAEAWRKHIGANAPVIDVSKLSEIEISQSLVDSFVNETLSHVDRVCLRKVQLSEYVEAYNAVEQVAIQNNAVLVGQFGNIKYPGISDLDVFICFEDEEYETGCDNVMKTIEGDQALNYLFVHTPLFVPLSMLNQIRYLHTLYDLHITHNPRNLTFEKDINPDYSSYLNLIWSYTFLTVGNGINTQNVKYIDIRQLLIILKNVQTSINNIEKLRKLPSSNVLAKGDIQRQNVAKYGIEARAGVVEELFLSINKYNELLAGWSEQNVPQKKVIKLADGTVYRLSDKSECYHYNGKKIYLLNEVYYKLIYDIIFRKNANAEVYYNVLKYYLNIYQQSGGYINRHIFIIPDICLSDSFNYSLGEAKYYLRSIKNVILNRLKK